MLNKSITLGFGSCKGSGQKTQVGFFSDRSWSIVSKA